MSNRDPFPFPKLENDFTLGGYRPQQRQTYDKPTHIAQLEEPWGRLHDAATLASTRRSAMHNEEQGVPHDSLDLQLKSIYDQHKDLFWRKNQVLYQRETGLCDGHHKGREREEDQRVHGEE
ncbi:cilia- and flagella-associated protein 276 isoform X1 [Entelurus aequoreus]|uniref:cilia- and flagella-associated protein 276 isoform X1 n=1 Tax=Entelurus aequoreus TaxID=161455 RepID=UPI002B1DF197|nr:cilia- and flagella-associated protein 276 isoform X1 [Entelurus aequoreus]